MSLFLFLFLFFHKRNKEEKEFMNRESPFKQVVKGNYLELSESPHPFLVPA